VDDFQKLGELAESLSFEAFLVGTGLHRQDGLGRLIDQPPGCVPDLGVRAIYGHLQDFDLAFDRQFRGVV
jgi:hypothetical protein